MMQQQQQQQTTRRHVDGEGGTCAECHHPKIFNLHPRRRINRETLRTDRMHVHPTGSHSHHFTSNGTRTDFTLQEEKKKQDKVQ